MEDRGGACAVCGYVSNLGAVVRHHLIPRGVTREAGMPDSAAMNLCCNCHYELNSWYEAKVSGVAYDPAIKRFRGKSWDEVTKDYESAFNSFRKYKQERRRAVGKRG